MAEAKEDFCVLVIGAGKIRTNPYFIPANAEHEGSAGLLIAQGLKKAGHQLSMRYVP